MVVRVCVWMAGDRVWDVWRGGALVRVWVAGGGMFGWESMEGRGRGGVYGLLEEDIFVCWRGGRRGEDIGFEAWLRRRLVLFCVLFCAMYVRECGLAFGRRGRGVLLES